jgi:hypothetical protein
MRGVLYWETELCGKNPRKLSWEKYFREGYCVWVKSLKRQDFLWKKGKSPGKVNYPTWENGGI